MSDRKIGFQAWTFGGRTAIFTAAKVLDDVEGEVTLDLEFKWVAIKPEVILDVKAAEVNLPIKLEHIEAFRVVKQFSHHSCVVAVVRRNENRVRGQAND